jgi:hypothetical protein
MDAWAYHRIDRLINGAGFRLRNLSVDLKIFNTFAIREFVVKKCDCLFAPLNIR